MKTKISPTIVGLFVLGAFALALVGLFSFGGVHFFEQPERFVVYFDESIHGLDLGSPVKLRGVRIGHVVGLNIRYNSQTDASVVAVTCELSRNVILNEHGDWLEVTKRGELQKLVDRGLRARLETLSFTTGLLFVGLDFFEPNAAPIAHTYPSSKYTIVPSVPSAISEFQASLSEILANLRKVDFVGLSNELRGTLVDTRKQINGLNLAQLNAEWTRAGESVNTLVQSPEIKHVIASLDGAIDQLSHTLQKIDSQVDPRSQDLAATLAEAQKSLRAFNDAATAARNFISSQSGLGEDAARSLAQLADAAAAVQRLADFLERNPNALITGKKGPRH